MLRHRVIPCLDVADGRVVKGTRFVDLVDEGDPPELAERYAAEGADELVFLDITAAPERRGTLLDIVERTARRAFIPLTVGGGVRSVDEMRDVLRAGADKVSLNTAAVADPGLISALRGAVRAAGRRRRDRCAATNRGARCAGRDGRRPDGRSSSRADASRPGSTPSPGRNARSSSARASCSSRPSIATGPAPASTPSCCGRSRDRVIVPVIASGGAAGPDDFVAAIRDGGADAVLAASIFHRRIHAIADVKAAMAAAGIPVRLVPEAVA